MPWLVVWSRSLAGRLPAPAGVAALAALAAEVARPVLAGLGLVDRQRAALELGAVEVGNRLVRPVRHFDEGKAARAAGLPVLHDLGRRDAAEVAERLQEVVRGGAEGQVADVQFLTQRDPFLGPQAQQNTAEVQPSGTARKGGGRGGGCRPRRGPFPTRAVAGGRP